jgi:hypothetical protein
VSVSEIYESIEDPQWEDVSIRDTTKGVLKVKAACRKVYVWDGLERRSRSWWLVFQFDPKTNEKKYFLSNADDSVTLEMMVKKHACRYWIERSFQDGKTSVGMADYQVRKWFGWHHHMSLVMLAMLFLLKERNVNKKELSLLSCQDIVELLDHYLPRRDRTEKEVFMNMYIRHVQRQKSIESAFRKQCMQKLE